MKTRRIGGNTQELITTGYKVLLSYSQPVAYLNRKTGKYYSTEKKWSKTTSRHILNWVRAMIAKAEDEGRKKPEFGSDVSQNKLDKFLAKLYAEKASQ